MIANKEQCRLLWIARLKSCFREVFPKYSMSSVIKYKSSLLLSFRDYWEKAQSHLATACPSMTNTSRLFASHYQTGRGGGVRRSSGVRAIRGTIWIRDDPWTWGWENMLQILNSGQRDLYKSEGLFRWALIHFAIHRTRSYTYASVIQYVLLQWHVLL